MADRTVAVHIDTEQVVGQVKRHIAERVEPLLGIVRAAIAWHDSVATPNNPFLDDDERALSEAVQAYRAALAETDAEPTEAAEAMTLAQVMDGARGREAPVTRRPWLFHEDYERIAPMQDRPAYPANVPPRLAAPPDPPPPASGAQLLTGDEHHAVALTADLWNTLARVVGNNTSRGADLAEIAHHVHAIQNAVLAQAAARAYPDRYRLLGERLEVAEPR